VIFHRKRGDRLPPQARYNTPIEIMFTSVPFVLIAVLFYFTAKDENYIDNLPKHPAVQVEVLGFQWSWQFKYRLPPEQQRRRDEHREHGGEGPLPVLEIPMGETVQFDLTSQDVIHASGSRVPVQAGRHPRPPEPLHDHRHEDGTYTGTAASCAAFTTPRCCLR
jgi:cytochrome c oxidase subunit 2